MCGKYLKLNNVDESRNKGEVIKESGEESRKTRG